MSDVTLLRQLADLIAAGTPCATAQIVSVGGSIPNELGATMLVGAKGELLAGTVGGGAIEARTLEAAAAAIAEGKSRLVTSKLTDIGMMCGGSCDVFIAVHCAEPHLLLLGAGHVNLSLARLADGLGFRVTVVDDRPEWCNAENYPHAARVLALPEDALPDLGVDEQTYVVVATRDRDTPAIVAASKTPARYIGVVASKRKTITIVKDIADRVDLDALVPRLHAPIGLRLGGRSPEALALSILSEIQAAFHGAPADSMRLAPEELLCYVKPASGS